MSALKNSLKIVFVIIGMALVIFVIIGYCKIQEYEKTENQRLKNISDEIDRVAKQHNDEMERWRQREASRQATYEAERRRHKVEFDLKMAELNLEEQKALRELTKRSEKSK